MTIWLSFEFYFNVDKHFENYFTLSEKIWYMIRYDQIYSEMIIENKPWPRFHP